jgi:two-component system sensor histidine kinase MtrB
VVVANLVGNALRHGAPPVRLSLYADRRPARDAAGGGTERWAVIEVLDSGPGIAESALPHIFDRFYKSDTARTRTEGSGLGLAIAAENVHLHGGTLHAANHPGGGALFTVELPLPEPGEEDRS